MNDDDETTSESVSASTSEEKSTAAAGGSPRRRATAVRRVLRQWRSQLIDVSGSNRLLYYQDRKVATVDLSMLSANGVAELSTGRPVRVGRLCSDREELAAVVRSLKAIAKPARVYAEEYGLRITYIASGFATWEALDGGRSPCAPILLRQVSFRVLPGSADAFELEAAEDVQVNPVLLHLLEADYGILINDVDLLEATGGDEEALFERMVKLCEEELPGFGVEQRAVIANFAYPSQSMVADLADENVAFLAAHDMIAALAGDAEASDLVRATGAEVSLDEPDRCPPSDEHLILDADGSQSYVINAIVGGQHLVVQGPPGTGKTQTITNTVADLVARGKTVLFVAQKRAAIVAVLDRLRAADLDGIVLDLFDGASSRKAIVNELGTAIQRASVTARPRVDALHRAYGDARDLLVAHRDAMNETRPPWGLSLLGHKENDGSIVEGFYDWAILARDQESDIRLAVGDLERWDDSTHERLRDELVELFSAGGLRPNLFTAPGWSVAAFTSNEQLLTAEGLLDRLLHSELPALMSAVRALAADVEIAEPSALPDDWCRTLIALTGRIKDLQVHNLGALLAETMTAEELRRYKAATGSRPDRAGTDLGLLARRKVRKEFASLVPGGRHSQYEAVNNAIRIREEWAAFAGGPVPSPDHGAVEAARGGHDRVAKALADLALYTQALDVSTLEGLVTQLRGLRADRGRRRFPRINALRQSVAQRGAAAVIEDLTANSAESAAAAANRLSYAFARSIIEYLDKTDQRLAGYGSEDLTRATETLIQADESLREANVSRVRRAAAERLVAALDSFPGQAEALRGQVKRKRGFQPIRRLVDELAPDVILAAKPVWAASPQIVSQLLPARVLFDVVLFDEASQVLPAAALPSIARGRQVVVAGDDLQLPPTTVFTRTSELEFDDVNLDAVEPDDESPETDGAIEKGSQPLAEVPDTESILDAIGVKLGTQRSRHLAWHYRSRDEKLIATSNTFVYRPRGRLMTTFPAADSAGALSLVQCAPSVGLGKSNLSPIGEVDAVVDLMFRHALEQQNTEKPLSIGVIAFGAKHAARIERAFDERLLGASEETQSYFADEEREPFFIKNIERVQGDERDVIVLTVGYSRGADGRLRYSWGPVLTEGGHRRVNVAITRARARMVLVTSFGFAEVDPNASTAEGFALMTRFLQYAASGGTDFGDDGATHVPCNPFEADIQMRLEEHGLRITPQWGVGGYRLDFAVHHPQRPGQFLLAVEADGASYHSGTVARERDRLRQQQLEARGWRFVRIWSSDYFFDPDKEIGRVLDAYEDELAKTAGRRSRRSKLGVGGVEVAAEPPPTAPLPDWDHVEVQRGPRPRGVPFGPPISLYMDEDLRAIVRWIISDDLLRTRAEVYEAAKAELGFRRDGKVIRQRIMEAVEAVIPGSSG